MKSRTLTAIVAAVGAAALLVATQAAAHAQLVSSNPAANASVAPPKSITLTFNEKLVPAFSSFEMVMVDHDMRAPVKTVVSKDGLSIVGTPKGKLMKGVYKITWRAASADGHRMKGEISFKVH